GTEQLGGIPRTNSTVGGNSARNGGGLDNVSGTATLVNTIVAGQSRGGDILVVTDTVLGNYCLIGDGSGISGGSGNLLGSSSNPINPRLAPPGDYGRRHPPP